MSSPLSSVELWRPIPQPKEIGRIEAFYRRTDHQLPVWGRRRHTREGFMLASWQSHPLTTN